MSKVRAIVVVAAALLAIAQIVRTAFVAAYASRYAAEGGRCLAVASRRVCSRPHWTRLRAAAAAGQPVPKATDRGDLLPRRSALRWRPSRFWFAGSRRSWPAIRRWPSAHSWRPDVADPRSLAAHYFLADHYLRTNQTDAGPAELARLTRLVPQQHRGGCALSMPNYATEPGGAARGQGHAPGASGIRGRRAERPGQRTQPMPTLSSTLRAGVAIDRAIRRRGMASWSKASSRPGNYAKARAVWAKLSGASGAAESEPVRSEVFGERRRRRRSTGPCCRPLPGLRKGRATAGFTSSITAAIMRHWPARR